MDIFKKKIKNANKIPGKDNASEVESKPVDMQPVIQETVVIDTSPKFIKRAQNKVALNEVEEKLKSMRQKRLDRLSTFVAEQSKLSEERNKNVDSDEIEEAIKTIQIKPTFKTIVEEKVIIKENSVPNSPILSRKDSKEKNKSSSTRNFINKLTCTVSQGVMSSNEDLTKEDDNLEVQKPLVQETVVESRPILKLDTSIKEEDEKGPSFLLSPVGKQRKGIYMYETEFLEIFDNEKQETTTTFKTFGKMDEQQKVVKHPEEQAPKPESSSYTQKQKVSSVYENSVILKNETTNPDSKRNFTLKKSEKISKLPKINLNGARSYEENLFIPRSPMPSPRKLNQAERVLKKLQRNWDSLNEIMENDSDVDGDEIEDMKKTFEEANTLLEQYQKRIKKLERKSQDDANLEKIREVKQQLVDIGGAVKLFRGLRRDNVYKQLSNRLSNYFVDINRISSMKEEIEGEKKYILEEIDKIIKDLETKVSKNEVRLLQIFEEQVSFIGTNRLNITSV